MDKGTSVVNRQARIIALSRLFPGDFTVAVNPDHPNLFDGPDVLAARAGHLVAVFLPKSTEITSPDRLEVRLVLSRLALPRHARCILAYTQDDVDRGFSAEAFEPHFHGILGLGKARQLENVVEDPHLGHPEQDIPNWIRESVHDRFAFLLDISSEFGAAAVQLTPAIHEGLATYHLDSSRTLRPLAANSALPPAIVKRYKAAYPSFINKTRIVDGVLVALSPEKGNRSLKVLQSYLTPFVQICYRIENGVPVPRRHWAGLFVTDRLPVNRLDPAKPIHAAALAGWAIASSPSEDQIMDTVKRISSWLEKDAAKQSSTANIDSSDADCGEPDPRK